MAESYTVVATDFLDEASVESEVLGGLARVVLARATDEEGLAPYLESADALLVFHDIPMLTERSLGRAVRCRGVVRGGVGFNNIDLEAAGRRGIPVCNVPDYGTEEVADHAMMMLLALARRLVPCHEDIRGGGWEVSTIHGAPRLRGQTLGIVGCGRIGTATALRAKAFGLDVVFFDPLVPPGYEKALGVRRTETLAELMRQSRFVSIHCYLDETTHHLIDGSALAEMAPGGYVINTARGPVVDQEALLEALESGHLAGAALDVVEREPLDDERLRLHPRVLLTPHVAFYSVEAYREMRVKGAEEIRRLLLGLPPRCLVNGKWLVPRG